MARLLSVRPSKPAKNQKANDSKADDSLTAHLPQPLGRLADRLTSITMVAALDVRAKTVFLAIVESDLSLVQRR